MSGMNGVLETGRLQRGQRMAVNAARARHAIAPTTARLVENTRTRDTANEALLPGMRLDVTGEPFSTDRMVVRERSGVHADLLTDDVRPASVRVGQMVHAGTLSVESPLRVQVEQTGESHDGHLRLRSCSWWRPVRS